MADMDVESTPSSSSAAPRTRRRDVQPVVPASDAGSEEEEDDEDGPQSSAKRRRVDGPAENGDDEEEEGDVKPAVPIQVRRVIKRDVKDGYVAGSIVRIAAYQFLTYTQVEFQLGPKLNMIIGPNGAGKSSIVCAIALGLGFDPKVLGRSTDPAAFIRTGCTEAWIEVELKGEPGKPNVIVKRDLKTELVDDLKKPGKKRLKLTNTFAINGRTKPHKDVQEVVGSLNVDVTNLCCFLPQDRVAEFAKLSPPALLEKTQESAGAGRLKDWHAELIEKKKQLVSDIEKLNDLEAMLTHKNEGMRGLERDVQRFKERQVHERNLAIIKLAIPFSRYQEAKEAYDLLRKDKVAADAALAEAEREHEPFVRTRDALKRRVTKLEAAGKTIPARFTRTSADMQAKQSQFTKLDDAWGILRNKFDDVDQQDKKRLSDIRKHKRRIEELKDKVASSEPPKVDTAALDAEIAKGNQKARQCSREVDDVKQQFRDIDSEDSRQRSRLDNATQRLARVQNVAAQREHRFASQNEAKPTYRAMEWIRQNAGMLRDGCSDAVALAVTIKEPRFAKAIETMLPDHAFKTLVAKSRHDYGIIAAEVQNRLKVRFPMAENEGRTMADYQAPWDRQKLAALGFDCWALDCVDAPPEVLLYLCAVCNLHRVPLAINPNRIQHAEVERHDSGVRRYVAGDQLVTIGFSQYGNRESHSTSRFLKGNRWFTEGVDPAQVKAAEREVAEVEQRRAELHEQRQAFSEQRNALEKQIEDIKKEGAVWQRKKDQATAAFRDFQKAKTDLRTAEVQLSTAEARPTAEVERGAVMDKMKAAARQRMAAVLTLKALTLKLLDIQNEQTKWNFEIMQAKSDLDNLDQSSGERETAVREARERAEQFAAETAQTKAAALALLKDANAMLGGADKETGAAYQEFVAEHGLGPSEGLESQADELRNTLEMTAQVAGAVVNNYETRKKEIEKLEEQLTKDRRNKLKKEKAVDVLKNQWEPAIRQLVDQISEKFSASFTEMGLAGEVKILDDAIDYAKWGIDIRVAFRDVDEVMSLSGQRQSGGERALSTITYLMALTTLANSPFTVVDEINQGMDQRSERNMHDQLVAETCGPEANQYFLITPKLLPNLRYHPDMRILCVCNGDWCPEKLSLADTLALKRAAMAAR